jgi:hypothetical protein
MWLLWRNVPEDSILHVYFRYGFHGVTKVECITSKGYKHIADITHYSSRGQNLLIKYQHQCPHITVIDKAQKLHFF